MILQQHGFSGATFKGKKFFLQNIPVWDGQNRKQFIAKISSISKALEAKNSSVKCHLEFYEVKILNQENYGCYASDKT